MLVWPDRSRLRKQRGPLSLYARQSTFSISNVKEKNKNWGYVNGRLVVCWVKRMQHEAKRKSEGASAEEIQYQDATRGKTHPASCH